MVGTFCIEADSHSPATKIISQQSVELMGHIETLLWIFYLFGRFNRNISLFPYFVNGFMGFFQKKAADLLQSAALCGKCSVFRQLKYNGVTADEVCPLAVVLPFQMGISVGVFRVQIAVRIGKLVIDINIEDVLPICQ